jgi:hypothetical protein
MSALAHVGLASEIQMFWNQVRYLIFIILYHLLFISCLRRGFTAVRLLALWVRIPLGAWRSISCECCVLSDRGSCVGVITRPEDSYRVWCV